MTMDSDQQRILEIIAENAANKAAQSAADQGKKDMAEALRISADCMDAKLPKLVGDLVEKIFTKQANLLRKDIGNALGTDLDKQDQVQTLQNNLFYLNRMVTNRDRSIMTAKQVLINWIVRAFIAILLVGFGVVFSEMVVIESDSPSRINFNIGGTR